MVCTISSHKQLNQYLLKLALIYLWQGEFRFVPRTGHSPLQGEIVMNLREYIKLMTFCTTGPFTSFTYSIFASKLSYSNLFSSTRCPLADLACLHGVLSGSNCKKHETVLTEVPQLKSKQFTMNSCLSNIIPINTLI